MKAMILGWSGSNVGVTVGNTYEVNPDCRNQFIDGNGDVRPLSMARYAFVRLVLENDVFRSKTGETIEMKTKRQMK